MKLSEEMAVRLHRMMWSDMQRELGDRPDGNERSRFKSEWIKRNFPSESVANDCWLCEYASSQACRKGGDPYCMYCPIKWPNCHCNTIGFSYAKDPISDILALPAKNVANDSEHVAYSYYKCREDLLSNASGLPASSSIEDHVKAIQEKAMQQSTFSVMYCDAKKELAKASGRPEADGVASHIKAIQEKAIEDYFKKTPGAKLATMDVDQAFKQYADEQKAPIFHALAEASGLSAGNKSFKAHISLIRDTAKQNGRLERRGELFQALSVYSGVSKDNWSIHDHAEAIMKQASNEKDMEILRKTSMQLADKLNDYKDALSKQSGLDRNRPIDDHLREIVKNSMEAGATEERDRIQEKIYEVLLS